MGIGQFVAVLTFFAVVAGSPPAVAGSLDALQSAVDGQASSGGISDPDVRGMLTDLIAKARTAADSVAEASLRGSIIDIVDSFEGMGVTQEAASALRSLARYE